MWAMTETETLQQVIAERDGLRALLFGPPGDVNDPALTDAASCTLHTFRLAAGLGIIDPEYALEVLDDSRKEMHFGARHHSEQAAAAESRGDLAGALHHERNAVQYLWGALSQYYAKEQIGLVPPRELFVMLYGAVRYTLGYKAGYKATHSAVRRHGRRLQRWQLLRLADLIRDRLRWDRKHIAEIKGTAQYHRQWEKLAAWCERQAEVSNG